MVSPVSTLQSLINTQIRANIGTDKVAGLVGSASGKFDALGLLQKQFGSDDGASSENAALRDFITDNIPNSESLLKDLSAVEALANLTKNGELSSPSGAFVNSYKAALALGEDSEKSSGNSALSLLV